MTTTRLEITSGYLKGAVHEAFDRLPPHVKARLAVMKLEYVTDLPCPQLGGHLGVCLRWDDGHQGIHLAPELAQRPPHEIAEVVAHEFFHACQSQFRGTEYDEAFVKMHTDDWAPSPYPIYHPPRK